MRYHCLLRWGDLDAQGHLNNAAYLDYLQEARVAFLLAGPSPLPELLATGVLVVGHQVEYLAPGEFSDRGLEIELWVDAVGGSRFQVGYDVLDGDRLVARARTGAVPYDLAGERLRRLTGDERRLLTAELAPREPLRALPRVRWSAAEVTAHRYPLAVRWSDLDSYGHVNNVTFFTYVQEGRVSLIRECLGWGPEDVWVIVRQDLEYLRPLDFRTAPCEVATVVAATGTRSVTLAAEIRDPADGLVFATARTVLVARSPLTDRQREALARYAVPPTSPS